MQNYNLVGHKMEYNYVSIVKIFKMQINYAEYVILHVIKILNFCSILSSLFSL